MASSAGHGRRTTPWAAPDFSRSSQGTGPGPRPPRSAGASINPTAAAASPMTSARPARRPQLPDGGAPSAFDSFARPGPDQRVVGEGRGPLATKRRPGGSGPASPQQVAAADDEVDALAQVVDDDREPVGPVAVAVAERGVSPASATSSAHGPTRRPSSAPSRRRARRAGPARRRRDGGSRRDSPVRASDGRARAPRPRTSLREQSQPYTSPSPRSAASAAAYGASSSDWRTARRRREAQPARSSSSAASNSGPAARPGRGPRSATGHRPPRARPAPTRRWRSRRGRDAGSRSAPGRTGSARAVGLASSVGVVARSARSPRAVACLERPRGGEQPPVEGQQVGLGERALVGHRHPEQHLAFALGVADRPLARGVLGPAGLARQLGALVEQRRRGGGRGRRSSCAGAAARPSRCAGRAGRAVRHARHRTCERSNRAPGDSRAPPGRRSTRARRRAGS